MSYESVVKYTMKECTRLIQKEITLIYIFLDIGRSVYHFLQYIYTFQRDTQCCSTDWLLVHRCQLYMFRTVTVHPQELLLDAVCADYGMSCNIEYVMYE